jgi:hypothetical protein
MAYNLPAPMALGKKEGGAAAGTGGQTSRTGQTRRTKINVLSSLAYSSYYGMQEAMGSQKPQQITELP